jgi:hypothetical protein
MTPHPLTPSPYMERGRENHEGTKRGEPTPSLPMAMGREMKRGQRALSLLTQPIEVGFDTSDNYFCLPAPKAFD